MHIDWILAFLTLSAMEIVLGLDNIIFIAILVGKLPEKQRDKARRLGIFLALFTRLALLFSISWMMKLTEPLISLYRWEFSGKDLILLGGGLFLIFKATREIHEKLEHIEEKKKEIKNFSKSFGKVIFQIVLLDIIFSLDSVITAVGMAQDITVMVLAMLTAVGVMLALSDKISRFVETHPTIKILALSFLILIGVTLVIESMGEHVSKSYIYFAMAFSLVVEILSMRYQKNLEKKRR